MRTAIQIKKENEPTHRARRGALQSSVVFTHNIKSIINFKSNKTLEFGYFMMYLPLLQFNLSELDTI